MLPETTSSYLDRIGMTKAGAATMETLVALQAAHRRTIPFENLNIPLGRGISLDVEGLADKLIHQRRGGYCFEQNGLFLDVLRTIGFEARPLLARVWLMAEDTPPRTHTLNLIRLGGTDYVVDVGFGGSFMPVLPLAEGAEAKSEDGVMHRLVRDAEHGWVLERDAGSGPVRQYSFTTEPVWPADLEAANHWTSTRPRTRFTTLRVASMPIEGGYVSLSDRVLTIVRNGETETRTTETVAEYRSVLAEWFGLDFDEAEAETLFGD